MSSAKPINTAVWRKIIGDRALCGAAQGVEFSVMSKLNLWIPYSSGYVFVTLLSALTLYSASVGFRGSYRRPFNGSFARHCAQDTHSHCDMANREKTCK